MLELVRKSYSHLPTLVEKLQAYAIDIQSLATEELSMRSFDARVPLIGPAYNSAVLEIRQLLEQREKSAEVSSWFEQMNIRLRNAMGKEVSLELLLENICENEFAKGKRQIRRQQENALRLLSFVAILKT